MKWAGAGVPSANRITLLRDADGDGVAETRSVFLEGLNSPFGMALVGDDLYVANTDAVMRFPYQRGRHQDHRAGRKLTDLPAGPHQPSLDQEPDRQPRRHASSMRRSARTAMSARTASRTRSTAPRSWRSIAPAGSGASSHRACATRTASLAAADRRAVDRRQRARRARQRPRARLHDLGQGRRLLRLALQLLRHSTSTTRVEPQRPDLVAKAIAPDYALGAHTASLGLTFYTGHAVPARFAGGAFIGQHGSWNRNPPQRLQGGLRAVRRTASRPASRKTC